MKHHIWQNIQKTFGNSWLKFDQGTKQICKWWFLGWKEGGGNSGEGSADV